MPWPGRVPRSHATSWLEVGSGISREVQLILKHEAESAGALARISEPWGVRSVPVRKKAGKKRQSVGYNYFASFAGMLCVGPVQTLHAIWMT